MSRISRAMAGPAIAVAVAASGLLITTASALPAHAATRGTPPGGHTITTTVKAHPPAGATSGIGPKFQCGDTCDPNGGGGNPPPTPTTITCTLTAEAPVVDTNNASVIANFDVDCSSEVPAIRYTQTVLRNGALATRRTNTVPNVEGFASGSVIGCDTASSYQNIVDVLVTLPPGWVVIAGFNPMHAESAVVFVPPFGCSGPGVGGGGCAAAANTPSLTGQPAGRHPDVITCP
jgi:hypothetical protein